MTVCHSPPLGNKVVIFGERDELGESESAATRKYGLDSRLLHNHSDFVWARGAYLGAKILFDMAYHFFTGIRRVAKLELSSRDLDRALD